MSSGAEGSSTANDPKLTDCGATAQPVPGSAAEAPDVTARSSSVQRIVRRCDDSEKVVNDTDRFNLEKLMIDNFKGSKDFLI